MIIVVGSGTESLTEMQGMAIAEVHLQGLIVIVQAITGTIEAAQAHQHEVEVMNNSVNATSATEYTEKLQLAAHTFSDNIIFMIVLLIQTQVIYGNKCRTWNGGAQGAIHETLLAIIHVVVHRAQGEMICADNFGSPGLRGNRLIQILSQIRNDDGHFIIRSQREECQEERMRITNGHQRF